MSAKSCCVKVKNCGGKEGGQSESLMFVIELAGEKLTPELEKKISKHYDRSNDRKDELIAAVSALTD